MLRHKFRILEEKEQIYISDDLISYIFDTLNWIDTFSDLKTIEKQKVLIIME